MPEVGRIKGIIFRVYNGDHLPPHFHAFYGEYEALMDIRKATIIAGGLPRKKLREALEYLAENLDALLETFYELNPQLRK